ncbi:MAG: hypothetical protein JJD98_11200 [Polaromonas sp.]|nr:hypothetical protein [Polaromonas sp.]
MALAFIAGFLFYISDNSRESVQTIKNEQKKTAGRPAVFGDLLRFFGLRESLSTAEGA